MARELHIQRCNEAILSDIKNIENLTIINTNTLKLDIRNAQSSLDVNVRGKRKPRFLNRNVGTHLEAASLDRLGNISLVNVKLSPSLTARQTLLTRPNVWNLRSNLRP